MKFVVAKILLVFLDSAQVVESGGKQIHPRTYHGVDVGIATPNMSSIWFQYRDWLSPSADKIDNTWANIRMGKVHCIYRDADVVPIWQYARLQTIAERYRVGETILKRGLQKFSTTGNLHIWCAIRQTKPNKCYRIDTNRQNRSQRGWYPRLTDFLRMIDTSTMESTKFRTMIKLALVSSFVLLK